ncbi:transcriptional regulator [Flavobacterium suaedae]|uniref:Transcriptional regulator n=1 Tax=Flavobacterium suaedae TaxID=1767027 RepID=A0ABQ1JHZ9_9FLAO|nr:winged helix-turn-helix domain-containing protein [Flavobacterium suaedae]GGB69018.1 transcriptional regulator [Flavobacterium suaedae]
MKIITINPKSGTPKYQQITEGVIDAIANKKLKRGEKLPSVNKVALEFSLSRDTVLLAYEKLKKRGIIYAAKGKGYYVKSEEFISHEQRIFLLFDELNTFKEDLYNSFMVTIGNQAKADVFFHYFNPDVFKKLIKENNGYYSKYVIMPTNLKEAAESIKQLPEKDVYILDQTNKELYNYPSVHQNFEKDIFNGLTQAHKKLLRYKKLILVFDDFKQPKGMVKGFTQYCIRQNFQYDIVAEFTTNTINKGEVYIVPDDRHLVNIILQAKKQELQTGTDFGIISYNDTPLKKVVENGVTTISTDFKDMGKLLAEMVLNNKRETIENQSQLLLRNSL